MSRTPFRFAVAVLIATIAAGCSSAATKKQRFLDRGNQQFAKGDYRAAIIEYRSALQVDAKFGQARYRLAAAYEKSSDYANALRESVRAADLLPTDTAAQLQAARLLLATGQFEDAASRAQKVLDREPRNVEALMLLGGASSGLKDADKVLARLDEAVKQVPNEPRLLETVGVLLANRRDSPGAEAAFKKAIEIAPQSVPAYEALANYYWSVGKWPEAEQTLRTALPIDAAGTKIARDLATLFVMQGRDADAEPYLAKIVAATAKETQMRAALGDLYVRQQRFDLALKTYEPLLKEPVWANAAAARMAMADYAAGRKPAAHDRLDKGLKAAPRDPDLLVMKARLLLADGRPADAEGFARTAVNVAEIYQSLYTLGVSLVEQNKLNDAMVMLQKAAAASPTAVGPKMQLASIYARRRDFNAALPLARDAVQLNPKSSPARLLLVQILTAQGDAAAARQVLEPLLAVTPVPPQVQVAAGAIAQLQGKRDEARQAYARALEANPASPEALSALTDHDIQSGKVKEAVAAAKRALDARPRDASLLMIAARTELAAKNPAGAEKYLQTAIDASPATSADAYGALVQLYISQKRLDEAKAQLEALSRQQPTAVGPPTLVAVILQVQGKPKEAVAQYEKVLRIDPNAAVAANNLAQLLVDTGGDLDMALVHAQTAKKALPNDADVSDTLGQVYCKKRLFTLGIPALEFSTRQQPNNPEFWHHLGQAYVGAGDLPKAREALAHALKLSNQFNGAADARRMLDTLGT